MRKMDKPKAKKYSLSQTINLKDEFGVDFRGKDSLKELVGEAIVEHIRKRAKSGKAIGGKRNLKSPYSDAYEKSDDFNAAGKSKGDVNMTLSGDMLGLMDFKISGNKLIIGWDDPEEEAKAANHQSGVTVPKREFFGINKTEMTDIKKKMSPEIKAALKVKKTEGREQFESFIGSLIGEIVDRDGNEN